MSRQIIMNDILEYLTEKLLHQKQDIVTLYEAHLKVELCEFKLPVSTCILVAVAACNLEVLVEPRAHKQLLHQLRALRKSVELSRKPARSSLSFSSTRSVRCAALSGSERFSTASIALPIADSIFLRSYDATSPDRFTTDLMKFSVSLSLLDPRKLRHSGNTD